MGAQRMPSLKMMAVSIICVCYLLVLATDSSMALRWPDHSAEVLDTPKQHLWTTRGSSTLARFRNLLLKRSAMTGLSRASDGNARIFLGRNFHKSKNLMAKERRSIAKKAGTDFRRRYRRAVGDNLSQQDRTRREYERRLIESLHIIGYVQATRLYVREDPKLVPVGTVVGKVRKLHPYGKVKIVWPYEEFRNFSLNADTGEVTTTALMDFELIRMYNMTIRDFQYNFTDDQPYIQPPKPDPPSSKYVDHYLIVEVWDINDNPPRFDRDIGGAGQFSGRVNQFARAGTEILFLRPTDDDSGPRGRIRFNIVTEGQEETPFTIDPQTHKLKTSGRELEEGRYDVKIEALDYGMPPKTSNVQPVSVYVEKTPPEFVGIPYNLNFSEAHVRGSVVATVKALSRSGMPMTYEIDDEEAKNTFAINNLGEITLLRELDFDAASETDKRFQFFVTGQEDADEGLSRKVRVNLNLVNADDHLGMFKTPATKIRVKEGGSATGGDVFVVEVEDCDCERNCLCGSKEMIFTLGDTNGFFDITDDGQIRNIKALDYEAQNYFFFPVNVTDPGTNGRTRTSYVEVYVEDDDDTPPKFRFNEYKFFIFEDAPKDQIVGVAQAVDPDPSTKPDEVTYRIITATPNTGRQYFTVTNQGVIRVNENRDQFGSEDKYELVIEAKDNLRVSDPTATVIIRILDVNDHQPVFSNCVSQKIKENQPIGTVVTTLTATDQDRGLNKLIEYDIQRVQKNNYFHINDETGVVTTTHVLDRESYDDIFVIAKATDGGSERSEALRQVGYCQFIVQIEDVNDHHPEFTVAVFEVSVKRDLAAGNGVLQVEAVDPDLGDNAIIEYKILTQKDERDRNADYFQVDKTNGMLSVKNSLQTLALQAKISVVVQAVNTIPVVGPNANADAQSKTTVVVSITDKDPPKFQKMNYTINNVKEDVRPGSSVGKILVETASNTVLYSLQKEIRERDNLPFTVDSATGAIYTSKTLDYEQKTSYLFAITAKLGESRDVFSSAIVQIDIKDVDDVVPIFGNDRYEATVSEAAKGDTNVFRVKATDPDPINGGQIEYKIRQQYDYQNFTLTQESDYAQIKTRPGLPEGSFDRETKEVYNIIVEARRGEQLSTAFVSINVRDENDSPPIFKQKFYSVKVKEGDLKTPYIIPNLKVMAEDKDILENANVSYFITSGNDGRFEMRTQYDKDQKNYGNLTIVRPLDVEKTPEFQKNPVYNLTITATDRKHIDTATIEIIVEDQPENIPEFVEDYYEKYLPENVGAGVNVVKVEVKKPENIEFALDDVAKQYFSINKADGRITTSGKLLDWETTPVITFPVYAYDKKSPEQKGQTFVRVIVNDINDASPFFPDQPYIGYVPENSDTGFTVRFVNGKDADNPDVNFGNNVKLTYELVTNTGQEPYDKDGRLFELTSEGLLTTKVSFDLEEYRRNLTLRVRARDNGNPPLYGETDVTIVIEDENEFPALFRKPRYEASVSETQPPGFVVLQLTVKDRDFSPRDNYAFSMLDGNRPYAFDIRQETGEIVVVGVLDTDNPERPKRYELEVGLAERSGEFMVPGEVLGQDDVFQDIATVVIDITPGNDNRPTFTKEDKIYRTVVPEDIKVKTELNLTIEATDGDVGFSSNFTFVITKGNFGDWFGVKKDRNDPNKGIVFVQSPLDREYQSVYDMELVAKDNGGVMDTARLIVTVTDVNDNPPVFHSSFYHAIIRENSCTSSPSILTLTVTDPDKPEQGPFTFEFEQGGNPLNGFTLQTTSNTTTLICSRNFDREVNPYLKVVIKATDTPSPRQSSTANVFIEVEDEDEFPARNGRMRIIVNAIDGKFLGGPIGKTYFDDDDGDGGSSMEYTLTGSDEFTVKKDDGWISAKSTVKVGNYELRIQGSKPSANERPSCVVDVIVREVPKEAIQHSAAIQLRDVWNEKKFLNPISIDNEERYRDDTYYDDFVKRLAKLFVVPEEDVFVFSIQMSAKVMPGRQDPSLDVRFAIRKDSTVKSKFLPRYVLINELEKSNDTLQNLGFELGMIGIDYCVNETLRVGRCDNVVLSKDTYSVVSSDYGLRPVPNYALAVVSIDTTVDGVYSRYKADPDPEYDNCMPEFCLNGGTCHDVLPHGFVCECPSEYSGPRCQLTTRTFLGNSYIWLHPKTPHNYGSISFEFATKEEDGLLLYQGPAVKGGNNKHDDFLAVSLVKGKIKVALSFGGRKPLTVNLDKSKKLNNKKWHHVEISHQRKVVTVILDHCKFADIVEDDEKIVEKRENCELISKTTGNFEYLNGLGPIQVGGIENMPLEYPSSEYVLYKSFRGCIRKIRENLEMYDLGYPLKVVNAPVGCTLMAKCPSCKNGGYCYPGFSRSICTCPMGFIGDDCSGKAPRLWYQPNSFTEYRLPGEERRRKRAVFQEPGSLLDRYSAYIAMQLRVDPEVKKAMFLFASSETNMEYSILGYEDRKLYFEFKLLDALTRLEMPGAVEIADGNWHNVIVTREGNMAVLQVDYKGRVSRNTGGIKKLVKMTGGKLYVGGMPDIAPNATIINKTVEAKATDIRRRRRSAGTILGVTTDGRPVSSVDGDMTGCTGASSYNGHNLDTDPNIKAIRFNVKTGCPCRQVLLCRNGGVCVSSAVPFCSCKPGWTGPTCEDIVYIPPVLGNRIDGRSRWRDGGVLIVILCVVLCVLVIAVALLFIKKRREAPYSVPVGDEGQDSIMPYHDDGAGEEDTFNYDIHHLMKYSYRDGHGTVTKEVNGKDIPMERMELLGQAPTATTTITERKVAMVRDSVDFWPFILERVQKADEDMSWWPEDEMYHWADEGDDEEAGDLSDIEGSDDEGGADAEQDWEFLKDWGRKFENLNKIFNPEDDDDEEAEA